MADIIVSDYELENQLDEIRTRWNAASTLRLAVNDITPTPNTNLAAFTEATFDNYASIDLSTPDDWSAPVEDADGEWSIQTDLHEFTPPDAGGSQTVYAVYVDDGTGVLCSARLDTPFVMEVGGLPLRVRVIYQHFAVSVLVNP